MKVVSQYEVNELNAGPKAKVDVERILQKEFNAKLRSLRVKINIHKKFNLFLFRIRKAFYLLFNKYINDTTVYNIPYNKSCNFSIKSKHTIALIHDINGLREQDDVLLNKEIEHFKKFDVIISHNKVMTDFLISKGVKCPIINLGVFDYLVSGKVNSMKQSEHTNKEIVFAGNLSKSTYLNELDEKKMKFSMNLYGVGNYNKENKKLNYKGSFLPDELPLHMEGDLGLVWDGSIDNINSENDRFLNYTKYNNPHKLSCYIAAGLPVIVWEKAACANFVKENNIGYVISNLYDINKLDFKDYSEKLKNVKKIQDKVTSGYYTIAAVNKALEYINKKK